MNQDMMDHKQLLNRIISDLPCTNYPGYEQQVKKLDEVLEEIYKKPCEEDSEAFKILNDAIENSEQKPSNANKWDIGWKENLDASRKHDCLLQLTPRYIGKLPWLRIDQRLFKVETRKTEEEAHNTLEYKVFTRLYDIIIDSYWEYSEKPRNIVEIGAGSCHHLTRFWQRHSGEHNGLSYTAVDWSKSTKEITDYLKIEKGMNIDYKFIDFKNPSSYPALESNSFIFSINGLEQASNMGKKAITWLGNQKPRICLHIEPIKDYLSEENKYDQLSLRYMEKRKYLTGIIKHTNNLEVGGAIKVKSRFRTFIANAFHENNSILAWEIV